MRYAVIFNQVVENLIILIPGDAIGFSALISPKELAQIQDGELCDIGYNATLENGQWVFTAPTQEE